MREIRGELFELIKQYDGMCVTTNGFVKRNGECVMGAGIAKTIKNMFPEIPYRLGQFIKQYGNNVLYIGDIEQVKPIFSFPVKHAWFEVADIELIKKSCIQLMEVIDDWNLETVLLPRPGCGNGKLNWLEVKEQIAPLLDDRVVVVTW
jgi:hypothetical protein